MTITDIREKIENISPENIKLFFITRVLKENLRKTSKVMDKYLFKVYQIEIDTEIRNYLFDLSKEQLDIVIKKDYELLEYDVISDDTEHLFTYAMTNNAMSFADVVYNQLSGNPPKVTSIEEILKQEELWAYCVGFYATETQKWIYSFRKILPSKVVIEESSNPEVMKSIRFIRAKFDTRSQKLEMLHGETINLDKQIDCLFYEEVFYVIRKGNFEQIIGLEAEFKQEALNVAQALEESEMILGVEILREQIEENPALHKKLMRISKIKNFNSINEEKIGKMNEICQKYGSSLKINDGKITIEEPKDIDQVLKILADYYKVGEVSGIPYGTFSGKELHPQAIS